MGRTQIDGDQVLDESITAKDIKDGSIGMSDLSSGVRNIFTNVIINTLELSALKSGAMNPDLTYFTDTFDDSTHIDIESTNYELNPSEGYVSLTEGGIIETKETSAQGQL